MRTIKKKLHFSHYLYIFLTIAIGTFLFFSWFISERLSGIKLEFESFAHKEAAMEVMRAMDNTINQITTLAAEITAWDEVHQQLGSPAYYGYWKMHRPSSRQLPDYIENLELYDIHKKILGRTADTQSLNTITTTESYYSIHNNRLYYFSIFPITSRVNMHDTIGYLLLRVNISMALLKSGQLVITDQSSVRTTNHEIPFIHPDKALSFLQFSAKQNPLFDELLHTTSLTLVYGLLLILLFTLSLYFFARKLINVPLNKLTNYMEQLKFGNHQKEIDLEFDLHEFDKLKRSIDVYQNELTRIHSNLDKKNDELWKLAHHDSLTGAANRRAYEEDWKSYIAIASHQRFDFSYMLIDCNHFKAINDTYGHDVGDKLIIKLVEILHRSLRDGDKLYRIGGDEFANILWNTDSKIAEKVAQRCLENIRSYSFIELGINEPVTVSIGIATHSKDTTTALDALPRQADIAMYHAKKSGSRSIIHYNISLETSFAPLVSNRIIDAVIRAASTTEGIVIHYQPVVNSKTLKIDYYEALLRIQDKQGLIGAGEIFPVAENLFLEAELDLAVLKKIEDDLKNKIIPSATGVSINFSAAVFSQPDLIQRLLPLKAYLADYAIIFEVTEKTLIADLNMVSMKLNELRHHGFEIALDDFGTGYSSIRYLANMPIDIVKFDISMTRQLTAEDRARAIISGTAEVILKAGFKLVAEGIENAELQNLVVKMGATHMQGYALGKPGRLDKK